MSEYNEFENNEFSGYNEFEQYTNNFQRPKKRGWSFVSLISGVLAFFSSILGVAGIVFGILAVLSSLISRKTEGRFEKFSIIGLILGIIGIIAGTIILIAILSSGAEFWNFYIEEFSKAYAETF
jgi:hypothetical protein